MFMYTQTFTKELKAESESFSFRARQRRNRNTDISCRSPGFALSLVAEFTTGALLSAEKAAQPGDAAEDVGLAAAKMLLREISKGGCVDTSSQWLNLLLMVLSPEDVSKIRLGQLSPFT